MNTKLKKYSWVVVAGLVILGFNGCVGRLGTSSQSGSSLPGDQQKKHPSSTLLEQLKPGDKAYCHYFRGLELEDSQEYVKAIQEYVKCEEILPTSPYLMVKIAVLYENLARATQQEEYLRNSLEYVDKALAIDPAYLPAYRQKANVYILIDPAKALETNLEIYNLNPRETSVLYDIGMLYHVTGDPATASRFLERYLDEDGDKVYLLETCYNLVIFYCIEKRFYDVIRSLNRLRFREIEANGNVAGLLDVIKERQQKYYQAFKKFLDEEISLNKVPPDQYKTLLVIASVMKINKQLDPVFRGLLDKYPDDIDAVVDYARYLYWKENKPNTAINLLQNAIKEGKTHPDVYFYLGTFFRNQDQYQQALEIYSKGYKIYPHEVEFLFQMGVTYEEMGQINKAIEKLKETIRLEPYHAEARNYLAYLYAENSINLEQALAHIQVALSIKRNNAAFIDSLGWIYYKMGRYNDAVKELETAVKLMTKPEPVILDHLGDAYFKVGNLESALKKWKESLDINPKNMKVHMKIKNLESGKLTKIK